MSGLPSSLELEIVTPEREVVREHVEAVELPARGGALGVLPGHAPLVTELGMGALSYRQRGNTRFLAVIHGYAEVLPDRVIVLAEIAERAEEIDVDRARQARDRAQQRMERRGDTDFDWDRATFALERALIRLQVAGKGGAIANVEESERHSAP
jgi:F-type H+-transporting ATPase subunit epsilon